MEMDVDENRRVQQYQHLLCRTEGSHSPNCMMQVPRYTVSELHFGEFPRLRRLSMLESQFQDRSVCEHTIPSTRNVVDQ